MTMKAAIVVLLVTTAVVAAKETAERVRLTRGLAPEDAGRVPGAGVRTFVCAGGAVVLPLAAVNDDSCDCADGSDEPHTAACARGHFVCANAGYLPQRLPSAFVNDGVCDCCDGSDEWAARTPCPRTCPPSSLAPRAARIAGEDVVLATREGHAAPVRPALLAGVLSLLTCTAVFTAVACTRRARTRQVQHQKQQEDAEGQALWKDHVI